MLDLQKLLLDCGLPQGKRTKLVRHQDVRWDLPRLLAVGQFDEYQELQAKPVFNCDFIVSFIGQQYSHARLVGVYGVNGVEGPGDFGFSPNFIYPGMPRATWRYRLERQRGFEDLDDRVVIAWGESTRAWHQWLKPKEVVEILPRGYVAEFPGFDDVLITFQQLRDIVDNAPANREWHRMLGAVAGIYLITDGKTGKQYVGSAYGAEGVMGRWTSYARTGHGGNLLLQELVGEEVGRAKHFTFTLLRTLSTALTREEVFKVESLYKRKLGSRAFGLNAN